MTRPQQKSWANPLRVKVQAEVRLDLSRQCVLPAHKRDEQGEMVVVGYAVSRRSNGRWVPRRTVDR